MVMLKFGSPGNHNSANDFWSMVCALKFVIVDLLHAWKRDNAWDKKKRVNYM